VGSARRPCGPWISVEDLLDDCPASCELTQEQLQAAVDGATEYLFERSARQFAGACTAVLRPCVHAELTCLRRRCSPPFIDLGLYPVTEVLRVTQDGQDLPSGSYRVRARRYLDRLDGEGWPCCQDAALPATEEGTLEVVVGYGEAVPALGVSAALALACELSAAMRGDEKCRLPVRTRSVSRQGVSVTLADTTALPQGKTGLQQIDMFLAAYNPRGLQLGPSVWSPDTHPRHARA
jgi:hypothetical protein